MQIFKDNNLNTLPESSVSECIDKFYDDRYCKGYMEQWPVEIDAFQEKEEEVSVASYKRAKGGRRPLLPELPCVEVFQDLKESEKICGCGSELSRIGSEISKKLDIVPVKMQLIKNIRYKYACKSCEGIESEGGAVRIASLPPQLIPQGLLGKAVSYTLNQWERLERYTLNGLLRPDNNLAENAIRPFVVGRKNWLFAGHPSGAGASATIYSLLETAKANALEPYRYLRYLFERMPMAETEADYRALLPQYVDRNIVTTMKF